MSAAAADVACDVSSGKSAMQPASVPLTTDDRWRRVPGDPNSPLLQTLKVYFMSKIDKDAKEKLWRYAREWCFYANIDFEETSDPNTSHIRIAFEDGEGYNSAVGQVPCTPGSKTMNLQRFDKSGVQQKTLERKVRHEFGHALGLHHEHQLTDTNELLIPYKKKETLAWYKENCNWDEATTSFNVLEPKRKHGIHALKLKGMDQFSIMLYPVRDATLLSSGVELSNFCSSVSQGEEGMTELSVEDRVHIMRMYPGRKPHGYVRTPQNFACAGHCCQVRNTPDNKDNPRFMYSKGGKCFSCAETESYIFSCRECLRKQRIPFQLSSDVDWFCHGPCQAQRKWRPNF